MRKKQHRPQLNDCTVQLEFHVNGSVTWETRAFDGVRWAWCGDGKSESEAEARLAALAAFDRWHGLTVVRSTTVSFERGDL